MVKHASIDAATLRAVAEQTGAREIDVKRALLGLPVLDGGAPKIVAALVAAGVDPEWLHRISSGPRGGRPHADPAKTARIRAELLGGETASGTTGRAR